jgi:hypothetical protein
VAKTSQALFFAQKLTNIIFNPHAGHLLPCLLLPILNTAKEQRCCVTEKWLPR